MSHILFKISTEYHNNGTTLGLIDSTTAKSPDSTATSNPFSTDHTLSTNTDCTCRDQSSTTTLAFTETSQGQVTTSTPPDTSLDKTTSALASRSSIPDLDPEITTKDSFWVTDPILTTRELLFSSNPSVSTKESITNDDPQLFTTSTKDPLLVQLEFAFDLLEQIVDEVEVYNSTLEGKPFKRYMSRETSPGKVDQAYNSIGLATEAVSSLDVDNFEEATILALILALKGLEEANGYLSRRPDEVKSLKKKHPHVDEELGQLTNELASAQDAVERRIELILDLPEIPVEYLRGMSIVSIGYNFMK